MNLDRERIRERMPTNAQVERAFDSVVHSPILVGPVVALVMAFAGVILAEILLAVGWFTADVGAVSTGTSNVANLDAAQLTTVGSAGLLVWVVGHGVPWQMAGVAITLVPWGFALVGVILGRLGGRWLTYGARTCTPLRWWLSWALASGTYAGLVALATAFVAIPTVHVSTVRAFAMGLIVGGAGLFWGMRSQAPTMGFAEWIPSWLRTIVRSSVVSVGMLIGIAALALAASAIGHFDDITRVGTALEAGTWGSGVITVVQMGYVPTLVIWTVAYLLGAGVGLGPDVIMTPFLATSSSVELPPIPLLALLPESSSALAWMYPLIGVLAGLISGIFIARGAEQEPRLMRVAMAVASSAIAGVVVFILATLAQGSWGVEQLASWGPMPELTGSLAFVTMVVGSIATAITVRTGVFQRRSIRAFRSPGVAESSRHLTVVESAHTVEDDGAGAVLELVESEVALATVQEMDSHQLHEGEHDSRQ